MKVLDLFCGVGGATLGLQRAGFEVAAGVDVDEATAHAYERMTGVPSIVADVGDLRPGGVPGFDVVWASPPCQPYSGRKRLGSADPRDGVGSLMSFVERFRPAGVIVEEVPGFLSSAGAMLKRLWVLGYTVQHRVLNAAWYGVPQRRRRLIVVAVRGREWKPFPWPLDAVEPAGWNSVVEWSEATRKDWPRWITSRLKSPARNVLIHPQLNGGAKRRTLGVYPASAPAPTVTVNGIRRGFHAADGEGRTYLLGEHNAARFQGLPWPDGMSLTDVWIGNAVPPAMSEAVGGAFLRYSCGTSTAKGKGVV